MSIEDWLRWPTKSSDPAANAAIAVILAMAAIVLVVVGGMFLLPVVLVIGIAKGVHWYVNRPTPTDQLYAAGATAHRQREFSRRRRNSSTPIIDRFIDAIRDKLPAYHIYLTMVHIADALYKAENLDNPLPPLADRQCHRGGPLPRPTDRASAQDRGRAAHAGSLQRHARQMLSRFHRGACRRSQRRRRTNSPSATRSKPSPPFR